MQQQHTLWSYELRLDFGVVTYMRAISYNIGGDNRTLKGKSVVDLPKSDDLTIVKYMLQQQVTTRCNVTNNTPFTIYTSSDVIYFRELVLLYNPWPRT